jgi:hypothetical protein
MDNWPLILGLIAVMVLGLGAFAIIQNRRQAEIRKKYPGYPRGHWMGQGIGIGIAIGAGIGVALGNIALGVGIGLAIGVAIGAGQENRHKDEIRPITEEEDKLRRQSVLVAIGTLLVGLIILVITFLGARLF